MAKVTWLGSAKPDDPIYTSGLMVGGISSGRLSPRTPAKSGQAQPVLQDLNNLAVDPALNVLAAMDRAAEKDREAEQDREVPPKS